MELHRMENFNRYHRRHRNGRTSGWRCAIRKRNLFLRVFLSLKALLWCSSDYSDGTTVRLMNNRTKIS